MSTEPEEKLGDLKFWWIPQVPMQPFEVKVNNIEEAFLLYKTLANYDKFQFENNIKPDYCNAGGLTVLEQDVNDPTKTEWYDYYDEDGTDFNELMRDKW